MRKTSQLFLKINGKEYKIVTFSNKVTLYHLLIFLGYKLNLIDHSQFIEMKQLK